MSLVPGRVHWQASIAAQRTRVEPCLLIGLRRVAVSDSRCWLPSEVQVIVGEFRSAPG